MNFKAIHFDRLIAGRITVDNYDNLKIRLQYESAKDVKGKVAYFPLPCDRKRSAVETINVGDMSVLVYPKTGKTLYVSKDSKVPRALLRNSDYKITINPDNADYLVIPTIMEEDVAERFFNIIYLVKNPVETIMYYFMIVFGYCEEKKMRPEFIQEVKNKITEEISSPDGAITEFIYSDELAETKLEFIKNCAEIEQILTGTMKKEYILDTRIRLTAPTQFSLEALQIWDKMIDEREMMAKAIIASNWQQYPCTTAVFIDDHCLAYYGGEQLKYVRNSINFRYYERNGSFDPKMEVQPDDWNLLQDWLMLKAGVGIEGGFKPIKGDGIERLVRKAYCIKPLKITEPMMFQEIAALLKK